MVDLRRWLLWGPCSGGVYVLELAGERISHRYDGDAAGQAGDGPEEESVMAFLAHGTDPKGYGGSAIKTAVEEIRASLHGTYRLGVCCFISFDHGSPVEIFGELSCADVGRGGHRCSYDCAGRVTYETDVPHAQAAVGKPLVVGAWTCRGVASDPWGAESFATIRYATEV